MFDYEVVNSALDILLLSGSEIFIDFSIKRGVRKLPKVSFWLRSVRQTTKASPLSAVVVSGRIVYLCLLRLSSAALSSEERLENLVFL